MSKLFCQECGKELQYINAQHLKVHGLTVREYRKKYPDARVVSENTAKKTSKTLTGRTKETHDYLRRMAEKQRGRTKENCEGIRRQSEKMTGRTKETHPGLARMAKKMEGKTKENNEGVRRGTEKRTGRTKENDESVRKRAETMRGRTKESHEYIRIAAEKKKGRTKENHKGTKRMSEKLTGRTKETHKYLRIAGEKKRGRTKENNEGVRIRSEKMRGRTKETHEHIRRGIEKCKKTKSTKEWKENNPHWALGKTIETSEGVRSRAEKMRGRTKETHEHFRIVSEKMSEISRKRWQNPEYANKMKQYGKERWKNPEYAREIIRKTRGSGCVRPNKQEHKLDLIIQKTMCDEYLLNVNANTVLNGHIPDWINVNGQKKAINFNGTYWHLLQHQKNEPNLTKEMVEDRERVPYNQIGYDILFVWEDEFVDEEKLIEKIKSFNDSVK